MGLFSTEGSPGVVAGGGPVTCDAVLVLSCPMLLTPHHATLSSSHPRCLLLFCSSCSDFSSLCSCGDSRCQEAAVAQPYILQASAVPPMVSCSVVLELPLFLSLPKLYLVLADDGVTSLKPSYYFLLAYSLGHWKCSEDSPQI